MERGETGCSLQCGSTRVHEATASRTAPAVDGDAERARRDKKTGRRIARLITRRTCPDAGGVIGDRRATAGVCPAAMARRNSARGGHGNHSGCTSSSSLHRASKCDAIATAQTAAKMTRTASREARYANVLTLPFSRRSAARCQVAARAARCARQRQPLRAWPGAH